MRTRSVVVALALVGALIGTGAVASPASAAPPVEPTAIVAAPQNVGSMIQSGHIFGCVLGFNTILGCHATVSPAVTTIHWIQSDWHREWTMAVNVLSIYGFSCWEGNRVGLRTFTSSGSTTHWWWLTCTSAPPA